MKKIIWILGNLVIVFLLVVVVIGSEDKPDKLPKIFWPGYPGCPYKMPKIEITTEFAEPEQKEVMVYEVVYPSINAKWVRKFAEEKCGLKNVRKVDKEGCLADGWMLMPEPQGNFNLERTPRPKVWQWQSAADPHPTKEEVMEIARQFMVEHKELFAGQEWIEPKAGVGSIGCVYYLSQKINNIRTWGAGFALFIDIWKDLKVGLVYMSSPEVKPLKKYPIKSIKQALVDLKERGIKDVYIKNTIGPGDTFSIQSVELAYFLGPLSSPHRQKYMQPCYLFVGTRSDGKKVKALVPAIKDEYTDNTQCDPER